MFSILGRESGIADIADFNTSLVFSMNSGVCSFIIVSSVIICRYNTQVEYMSHVFVYFIKYSNRVSAAVFAYCVKCDFIFVKYSSRFSSVVIFELVNKEF